MAGKVDLSERRSRLSPAKRALLEKQLQDALTPKVKSQAIPRRPEQDTAPLSFAQEWWWFLEQWEPGNPAHNRPLALRLTGSLDVIALEQALSEILRRHEALRATFSTVEGRPVQTITPSQPLTLPVVDLGEQPPTKREAEARRLATEEAQRPFDLAQGPLLRAILLRLGGEEHVLLLVIHHIAFDGWSVRVLVEELASLYEAFVAGISSPLPDLPIQYADFAHWQRQWLQGEVLETQLAYWRETLAGFPTLNLPTDRPRPAVQTHRGARQSQTLSPSLLKSLKALSQQEHVTLFMTLLAAFKVLLHRYTNQDDIVVGSPIAGRTHVEIEGLIGFFVNMLVLRTDLSGNPTFRELLARVREVALGAYAHQDLPFEKLVAELQPERDLSRTPLFQIFFNMLNPPDVPTIELSELKMESFPLSTVHSNFDLTLYVKEEKKGIELALVYNTDLFSKERTIELLEQYKHLLSQIVKQPEERIVRYSLVTPAARAILPDPTQPLDSTWEEAIHARFSRQAHRFPEQLAVVDPYKAWTWKELDTRSNQLANYLIAGGIQPQDIVAIYGHRSGSLVWALLGILKAGAAFLILDPAYPASRLIDYLRIAKPRGWIQIEAAGALPETLEAFVTKSSYCCRLILPRRSTVAGRGLLGEYSTDTPGVAVGPDDLACVAFTSGSTGRPKGILGRHGSLSHFLPWQAEAFGLSGSDRFSMLSGLSHDPLQRDIFTPLWVGATIYVPDPDIIGMPGRLADWMAQKKITFVHLTPAMGRVLAETAAPDGCLSSLRCAFFVGDKLTKRDVARLRRLASEATCINSYGSTETQRAVGYYVVPSEPKETRAKSVYPVGRGMPDVQLLVLNVEQQLAGVGELGEIYVRSPHLARGYLEDEALTQACFLTNPFTAVASDRLYKTSDLGRYWPDGNVEILGRLDHQVKIRGFRIELGEIEAVLGQHSAVREVVVLAKEDETGDPSTPPFDYTQAKLRTGRRLVAYVVANQEPVSTIRELRDFLREKLPDYMAPSAFVMLDRLPMTPNGKVDRQAFPAPDWTRPELEEAFVAPRTPLESFIAEVWQEALGMDRVGMYDNFFNLGGHSLLAMRVIARLEKELGLRFHPRDLILQTLGQLASAGEERMHLIQPPQPTGLLQKVWNAIRGTISRNTKSRD